jgi:hypothetical protein
MMIAPSADDAALYTNADLSAAFLTADEKK